MTQNVFGGTLNLTQLLLNQRLQHKVTSGKKLLQCRERVFKQKRFQFQN